VSTSVRPDDLDRKQVRFADGVEGRVYYADFLDRPVPSVSTIKEERLTPDKDDAIDGWKEHYDGTTEYKSPHWKEQLKFKQLRGTLVHFAIFSQYGAQRSEEEDDAEYILKNWASERPAMNTGPDEDPIPFYGPPDKYDGSDPWDHVMRDTNWALSEWTDTVVPQLGITEDNIKACEQYVLDTEYGYAGQADLVYEPEDGPVTMADLKTGGGVRDDVKYQTAAYARAVPYDVERTMVIRLDPSNNEVEIQTNEDWDNSILGYEHHFLSLCEWVNQNKYPVTELDDSE